MVNNRLPDIVKALLGLTALSRLTDDLCTRRAYKNQPYVGSNAFSHKAGAHVNAIQKNPATFEHVEPEAVGNERIILISELSGGANVKIKLEELGMDHVTGDPEATLKVLKALKEAGTKGFSYEGADASFRMFVSAVLNEPDARFFELEGFRVVTDKRGRDAFSESDATVKVVVGDQTETTVGEGIGPVEALNNALRKALTCFYPQIKNMFLSDYRVHIIDPQHSERAITRVSIESTDSKTHWTTVGVSENIIEASWQALIDSIEYYLLTQHIPPQS